MSPLAVAAAGTLAERSRLGDPRGRSEGLPRLGVWPPIGGGVERDAHLPLTCVAREAALVGVVGTARLGGQKCPERPCYSPLGWHLPGAVMGKGEGEKKVKMKEGESQGSQLYC